jgi:aminocarboxymuconate-semialdehyde decarboxylase
MATRREFLKGIAGATAGMMVSASPARSFLPPPQANAATRRVVNVAGKRVKIIDVHAHCQFPEMAEVLKGTPLARYADNQARLFLGPPRIQLLDKLGIDMQVLDVNDFWWYSADRDLATKIVNAHNEGLSAWCAKYPDRFVALTSPALQFPELAAQQLEHAVKDLKMRGAAVGPHVEG